MKGDWDVAEQGEAAGDVGLSKRVGKAENGGVKETRGNGEVLKDTRDLLE